MMEIKFRNGNQKNSQQHVYFDIRKYAGGGDVDEVKPNPQANNVAQQLKPETFDKASSLVRISSFGSFIDKLNSNYTSEKPQLFNIPGFENSILSKIQPKSIEQQSADVDQEQLRPEQSINIGEYTGRITGGPNPQSYIWLQEKSKNKNIGRGKTPEQLWRRNYKKDVTLSPEGRTNWTQEEFVKALEEGYKAAGVNNDVMINYLIAQDALESGWGTAGGSLYNNFGNINAGSFKTDVALKYQKSEKDQKYYLTYYCAPETIKDYCDLKVNQLFKLKRYTNAGIDVNDMRAEDLIPKLLQAGYCENSPDGMVHKNYTNSCSQLARAIGNLRKKMKKENDQG